MRRGLFSALTKEEGEKERNNKENNTQAKQRTQIGKERQRGGGKEGGRKEDREMKLRALTHRFNNTRMSTNAATRDPQKITALVASASARFHEPALYLECVRLHCLVNERESISGKFSVNISQYTILVISLHFLTHQ